MFRSDPDLPSLISPRPDFPSITKIGTYHKPVTMDADFEVAHASRLRRWVLDVGRSAISACHPSLIARHSSLPFAWPFPSFMSRLRSKLALSREPAPHVAAVAGSGTSSR